MNSVPMITALRGALPYLRLFRGSTFVVKVGGEALESPAHLSSLVEQIGLLGQLGVRIVLVHGGGKQATDLEAKLGGESRFVDGRRITSESTIDAMVMALNGSARATLLGAFRSHGIDAVGLSGMDDGLIRATRRPPISTSEGSVDFGFVGQIESIQPDLLGLLMDGHIIPVVSPLACTNDGQPLNINADDVASHLAVALGAAKLILVTKPRGILRDVDDPQTLISQLTVPELETLEKTGVVATGMMPKAGAIKRALAGGVERVHVVSFAYPDALLTEIFTNEGCGTMIVAGDGA